MRAILGEAGFLHGFLHECANLGRRISDNGTGVSKGLHFVVSTTLSSRDNGTGVTHSSPRGCGTASDEGNDWLGVGSGLVVLGEVLCGVFFHGTADFTDENDTFGLVVVEQELDEVEGGGTGEGVTSDTDTEGLTKTDLGGLVDGLVRQGTGTGDDTDATRGVNVTGHDTDLATLGVDDTGAVGAYETRLGLGSESGSDTDLILLGDTFGDSDDEGDFVLDGLNDGVGGTGGRNVEDGSVGLCLANSLLDGTEDGQAKVSLTGLLGRNTADELSAVLESLLAVEGTGLTGETLADDTGVLVDEKVLDGILVRRASGGRGEAPSQGTAEGGSGVLEHVEKDMRWMKERW